MVSGITQPFFDYVNISSFEPVLYQYWRVGRCTSSWNTVDWQWPKYSSSLRRGAPSSDSRSKSCSLTRQQASLSHGILWNPIPSLNQGVSLWFASTMQRMDLHLSPPSVPSISIHASSVHNSLITSVPIQIFLTKYNFCLCFLVSNGLRLDRLCL